VSQLAMDEASAKPAASASLGAAAVSAHDGVPPQGGPSAPAVVRHLGHELPFVAPSSYLRPKPNSRTMSEPKPQGPLDREQMQGLVSLPEVARDISDRLSTDLAFFRPPRLVAEPPFSSAAFSLHAGYRARRNII
jgi:hypothetical protein